MCDVDLLTLRVRDGLYVLIYQCKVRTFCVTKCIHDVIYYNHITVRQIVTFYVTDCMFGAVPH